MVKRLSEFLIMGVRKMSLEEILKAGSAAIIGAAILAQAIIYQPHADAALTKKAYLPIFMNAESSGTTTQPPTLTSTPIPPTPTAIPPTPSSQYTEFEQALLKYTNIERQKYGLKQFADERKLAYIALEHSTDMASNSFFSHINLRGEGPTERAKRNQYPTYKSIGPGQYIDGVAENIALMSLASQSLSITPGETIKLGKGVVAAAGSNYDLPAKSIVDAFMQSPGHRTIMLTNYYDVLGVGVSGQEKKYLITLNFH